MSNPLDYVEKLASRARLERAPQGDVTALVMDRLQVGGNLLTRPMLVFAAGYALAAVVAVVYGFYLFDTMGDPLTMLFQEAAALTP
jgi:hypothetical protein